MASDAARYQGKVTIITGGARGIGRAIVELFVRHGSKVAFCDIQEDLGKEVEKKIQDGGHAGEVFFVKCDMSKDDEIKSLVETTVAKFGQIDCIINNAGCHPPAMTIDGFSGDDFRSLININVVGPFLLCKFALPYLRKVAGNIINMSSINATLSMRESVTYDTTKGAIWTMTRSIACDEGKHGVRANTISPGPIGTEMTQLFLETSGLGDPLEMARSWVTLGRLGTPEEVARGCLYLATEGTFCTGTDLKITGGCEIDSARHLSS